MEELLNTHSYDFKQKAYRASVPAATRNWSRRLRSTAFKRASFAVLAGTVDAAVITLSAVVVGVLYHSIVYGMDEMAEIFAGLGLVLATFFVVLNVSRDEYAIVTYLTFAGHLRRSFVVWNTAFILALVIAFLLKASSDLSRVAAVLFYGFGLINIWIARALVVAFAKSRANGGLISASRAVLVGSESELRTFTEAYRPWTVGMDIIASAVLRGPDTLEDDLVLAAASARVLRPDDIFILAPWSETAVVDACVAAFMQVPAAIHLGPQHVLDRFTKARVARIGRIASLHLVRQPLTTTEVVLKRVFDIAVASVLLVGLLPVFALIALAIKLDSRGSVFFVQRRYGFNQQTFRIVKFRSMVVAEDNRLLKSVQRNDARVTRLGRLMRRYNIDELPQILNVLRGDMSLVGPRPHALIHNQHYERVIADYARRHNMKPGITGWAQIHGFRGEIVSDEFMRTRLEHDLYYIDNWSLGLDLRILFKTISSSKAFENAY